MDEPATAAARYWIMIYLIDSGVRQPAAVSSGVLAAAAPAGKEEQ